MNTLLCTIPFLISLISGYSLMKALLPREKNPNGLIHLSLGAGLGLAINGYLTFLSFVVLQQFDQVLLLLLNITLLFFILAYLWKVDRLSLSTFSEGFGRFDMIIISTLILFSIPSWYYASLYPMGGWDAWQVWNFKSKFMLTAGGNWTNMFDAILWRTSPHYQLLLPSINVWGWSALNQPAPLVPMLTAHIFTFSTVALLVVALKELTGSKFSLFAGLPFLTLPFCVKIATSQYCDILIAFYLLAALYTLVKAYHTGGGAWIVLAGFLTGILSFTKSEAMVAALLISFFGTIYLIWQRPNIQKTALLFLGAVFVGALPTILFEVLYSPGNQTFINGLTSSVKPSTLYRLKMIFAFLVVGLKSKTWGGLWIVLLLGMVFKIRHLLRRDLLILPAVLTSYFLIILAYYYVNTQFEITWWLQVTLGRIQIAILPAMIFWIFLLVCGDKSAKEH